MKITKVHARQVIDSRGNPTVEADCYAGKFMGRAIVPSGASTGKHEALELRDSGSDFHGKSVSKAIKNVNEKISAKIVGMDVGAQRRIDQAMIDLDGTPNKNKLGANAILSASMACSRAAALSKKKALYEYFHDLFSYGKKKIVMPIPFFNVINGGAHAANKLDIQEYMIAPIGAKSFSESLQIGSEVYHQLKKVLKEKYGKDACNVGDEGGFAPPIVEPEEPMKLIMEATEELGYSEKVSIAMDIAASEFFAAERYSIGGKKLDETDMIDMYKEMISKYPIISIEDPFDEEQFGSFAKLVEAIGKKVQIVGDDLLVTNAERIRKAIEIRSCNALLLKVNQIGTISESMDAAKMALELGWNVMVSHRSGETEDSLIADLVVGLGVGQIKSGAPCRGERTAKYNQLLRIEEELGPKAKYADWNSIRE